MKLKNIEHGGITFPFSEVFGGWILPGGEWQGEPNVCTSKIQAQEFAKYCNGLLSDKTDYPLYFTAKPKKGID